MHQEKNFKNIGLAQVLLALRNTFLRGTTSHGKAIERMTNACFQERNGDGNNGTVVQNRNENSQWDTPHALRDGSRSRILQENVSTGVTAQFTGCRSTNLDIEGQFVPTITEYSISLPVKVDPESWNCVAGNISNTLCVIGQSNKPLEDAIARLQFQVLPRGILTEIYNLFRKEGYHIFPLPQDMDFEALTTLANRLSLPMFISLNIGDHVNYQHVIGICPYKFLQHPPPHFKS